MIAILGPTSSGKTSLAIQLAKTYKMAIISCDSRQIYRKFDIGTGKIPICSEFQINKCSEYYEIDGVKVYGYDIVDPEQVYSAYDFGVFAKDIEKKILKLGLIPLLVGGTGFYADAALGGISSMPEVKPDFEFRNKYSVLSTNDLLKLLPTSIVENLNSSELNNKQRLIRKFEIYTKLGEIPYSQLDTDNHELIVMNASNEYLYSRVDTWLDNIWKNLVTETSNLLAGSYRESVPMQGIIYKSIVQFLDSKLTEVESFNQSKFDLHKYIRRQKTWFRKYRKANIVDISRPTTYNEIDHIVKNVLNGI